MGGRLSAFCTTVLIEQGHLRWWALHRVRLQTFARRLNRLISLHDIEARLADFYTGVVRIEVYSDGRVQCCPRPIPNYKENWSIHWVQRESSSDASIKWVNRDAWGRIKQQHQVDLLGLMDSQGHCLETCIGNLFVYRPSTGQWLTAPTDGDILPGIMRSVFSVALMEMGESVQECLYQPEGEDELWMTNAVRGVVALGHNARSRRIIQHLSFDCDSSPVVYQHFLDACQNG